MGTNTDTNHVAKTDKPERRPDTLQRFRRKFVQQAWQHVVGDMPLELFHSSEVLAAERAACDDNLVLVVHKSRKIMFLNFSLKSAK